MKSLTINYQITADEETHNILIRTLRTMKALGDFGCSRDIEFPFDGDGAAALDVPGLSSVAVDQRKLETETERRDDRVSAVSVVPGRGAIANFLKGQAIYRSNRASNRGKDTHWSE